MSEPIRYSEVSNDWNGESAGLAPSANGEWVKWDDYDALHKKWIKAHSRANEIAIERNALLAAVAQWKPIETAPKDETMIIAHDCHRGCGMYGHDDTHIVSFKYGQWFGKDTYETHYPTHWMPLHNPPFA